MYSFKTKNGVEYLGDRDILVNPCGDYSSPKDVINGFRVWDCDRFFTDSEIAESRKLPSLKIESDCLSRQQFSDIDAIPMQSLLGISSGKLLLIMESIINEELPNVIKEWVMRNLYSNSKIIISSDASVYVKDKFSIQEGAKVPPYIHLKIKNL